MLAQFHIEMNDKNGGMPLEGSNRSSRGAPLSDCMNLLKSRRQKSPFRVVACAFNLRASQKETSENSYVES